MIMRLPSKGMDSPISFIRGSLIIFSLACVAGCPVRIFEPGENDFLIRFGIDRLAEVGDLALGNVAVPGFEMPLDPELVEYGSSVGRMLAIIFASGLGDRHQKSFEIGHLVSPSGALRKFGTLTQAGCGSGVFSAKTAS